MKHTHKKDVTQETLNAVVQKVKSTLTNVTTPPTAAPAKTAADGVVRTYDNVKAEFLKVLHALAPNQHALLTLTDYLQLHALSIYNSAQKAFLPRVDDAWQIREAEYLRVINKYPAQARQDMAYLAALTTMALSFGFRDFLGEVYMESEASNKHKGQFFTPYHLSVLAANLTIPTTCDHELTVLQPLTLMEPACGSGGMVIAAIDCLKQREINYQRMCLVAAIDVDLTCCHMAYIQLSLYGVPAIVYHGNTLSLETYATFLTPMMYMNGAAFRPWPTHKDTKGARAVQDVPLDMQALHALVLQSHMIKLKGRDDDRQT
jgi:type I restriction-modification system DNA methylase subunit